MPANLPAEARVVLDTIRGYAREEVADFLTHPEWDLVYSSEAYARWLEAGKRPSQFPYTGSVGTFWRSYHDTWKAAKQFYEIGTGTHVLLCVIGVSTAVEYVLKGIYEGTIARLFEPYRPKAAPTKIGTPPKWRASTRPSSPHVVGTSFGLPAHCAGFGVMSRCRARASSENGNDVWH